MKIQIEIDGTSQNLYHLRASNLDKNNLDEAIIKGFLKTNAYVRTRDSINSIEFILGDYRYISSNLLYDFGLDVLKHLDTFLFPNYVYGGEVTIPQKNRIFKIKSRIHAMIEVSYYWRPNERDNLDEYLTNTVLKAFDLMFDNSLFAKKGTSSADRDIINNMGKLGLNYHNSTTEAILKIKNIPMLVSLYDHLILLGHNNKRAKYMGFLIPILDRLAKTRKRWVEDEYLKLLLVDRGLLYKKLAFNMLIDNDVEYGHHDRVCSTAFGKGNHYSGLSSIIHSRGRFNTLYLKQELMVDNITYTDIFRHRLAHFFKQVMGSGYSSFCIQVATHERLYLPFFKSLFTKDVMVFPYKSRILIYSEIMKLDPMKIRYKSIKSNQKHKASIDYTLIPIDSLYTFMYATIRRESSPIVLEALFELASDYLDINDSKSIAKYVLKYEKYGRIWNKAIRLLDGVELLPMTDILFDTSRYMVKDTLSTKEVESKYNHLKELLRFILRNIQHLDSVQINIVLSELMILDEFEHMQWISYDTTYEQSQERKNISKSRMAVYKDLFKILLILRGRDMDSNLIMDRLSVKTIFIYIPAIMDNIFCTKSHTNDKYTLGLTSYGWRAEKLNALLMDAFKASLNHGMIDDYFALLTAINDKYDAFKPTVLDHNRVLLAAAIVMDTYNFLGFDKIGMYKLRGPKFIEEVQEFTGRVIV